MLFPRLQPLEDMHSPAGAMVLCDQLEHCLAGSPKPVPVINHGMVPLQRPAKRQRLVASRATTTVGVCPFGNDLLSRLWCGIQLGKLSFLQYSSSRAMRDQISQMRSQLEEDEQVKTLMAGLRGYNIDDSDFADDSVVMRLVNVDTDDPDDELPLTYSPELIEDYWGRRPVAVASRIAQLLGTPA